jgi:asparagine synthetase B (glutamine-hydrolysing)
MDSTLSWHLPKSARADSAFGVPLRLPAGTIPRGKRCRSRHYYPLPGGVLFGSEPKAILANPLADRSVTADGLRGLLTVVKNPEQAIFAGLHEPRPGHLLRVRRSGLATRRYGRWRRGTTPTSQSPGRGDT